MLSIKVVSTINEHFTQNYKLKTSTMHDTNYNYHNGALLMNLIILQIVPLIYNYSHTIYMQKNNIIVTNLDTSHNIHKHYTISFLSPSVIFLFLG